VQGPVASSTVVSFDGNNYVNLVNGNKDTYPDESTTKWRITDLPASGPYVHGSTYNVGATTMRDKRIYEFAPPRGVAREEAVNARYRYPGSVAQYPGNVSELINVSFDHGGTGVARRTCLQPTCTESHSNSSRTLGASET